MTLGDTFNMNGRCGRLDYFFYTFAVWIIAIIGFGIAFASSASGTVAGIMLGVPVMIATSFFIFWTTLCLTVRRLHDMNLSGHYAWLIYFLNFAAGAGSVTVIGSVLSLATLFVALWLYFMPGTEGTNNYGER